MSWLTCSYSRPVTPCSRTVVDTPRVPQDDVSGASLDLLPGAPSVQEPLQLMCFVVVRVLPFPAALGRLVLVRLKELVIQWQRPLEDHETAVVGAVLGEVHDALDAVLEAAVRRLVDVRPGGAPVALKLLFGEGQGDVDAVCSRSIPVRAGC